MTGTGAATPPCLFLFRTPGFLGGRDGFPYIHSIANAYAPRDGYQRRETRKGKHMAKKSKIKALKQEVASRKKKVARQEDKLKKAKKALKKAA